MNVEMLIPEPLKPGDHIRVVSPGLPSLALIPDRARRADLALRDLGFEVSYGEHAFAVSEDGMTAGTVVERASDLMDAFRDESVDAILLSDTGRGSRELSSWLNADEIAAHPKAFIGDCDSIFLHQYLISRAQMVSFYGCTFIMQFGEAGGPFSETIESFKSALMGTKPIDCLVALNRTAQFIEFYVPESENQVRARNIHGDWSWVRQGKAQGQLLGGEISMLPSLIQDFELQLKSAILFWDVGFHNRNPIRSQFEALHRCADLSDLAGMIVGAHPRVGLEEWASSVAALVREILPGTTFPVLANAGISHVMPSWIVPYGEQVILDDARGVVFPRKHARGQPLVGQGWPLGLQDDLRP